MIAYLRRLHHRHWVMSSPRRYMAHVRRQHRRPEVLEKLRAIPPAYTFTRTEPSREDTP